MRGNALADPTVVGLLQPFLVTYWYGHRDDDPPPEIRDYVFGRGSGPGPVRGTSNVKLLVLDPQGRFVDAFDSMPGRGSPGPMHETMPRYFAERLRRVRDQLELSTAKTTSRRVQLPEPEGDARAVRVFVRLDDPGMPAYYAPVVEVATPGDEAWESLEFPSKRRTLSAGVLKSCFRQVYPPGVMERQNKQTMYQWRIAEAEGTLTLEPAGADGRTRYALLGGKVRLTDEGSDGFSFDGTFTAVLTYDPSHPSPRSLRGTFEAVYPRQDRARGVVRRFPLTAILESLPVD